MESGVEKESDRTGPAAKSSDTAAAVAGKKKKGKEEEDERAEVASILYKGSSEVSTAQADSAYSSRGHSNYSSLGPISGPDAASNSYSSKSRSSNKQLSSKSSGSSGRSTQPGLVLGAGRPPPTEVGKLTGPCSGISRPPTTDDKDLFDRPFRKKKAKISHSSTESAQFPAEKEGVSTVSPPGFNSAQESKAAKVATLSQALGYVDQYRKSQASKADKSRRGPDQAELNDLAINLLEASQGAAGPAGPVAFPKGLEDRDKVPEDTVIQHEKKEDEGFCVAVSLHDGMVMQTTASLTSILGYPKDMWVARSFIDFVHPQDRETFISQVTENICLTLRDSQSEAGHSSHPRREYYAKSGSFFCRIRVYNSLKSGFSVKERKTRYNPFKLSVCFKDLSLESSSCNTTTTGGTARNPVGTGGVSNGPLGVSGGGSERVQSTFLFITAIPLTSAFTEPFQDMSAKVVALSGKPSFVTKHTAACTFSPPIDEASIPYLGFLPQDMSGDEIFNYIHPMDLPVLKEAFEAAMLEQGKPVSSKLIRFRVRNGGYVQLNSWWSSFINPWSRLLEFIHGKHFVLKGPRLPDVFADPVRSEGIGCGALALTEEEEEAVGTVTAPDIQLPKEDLAKENLCVQNDIRNILRRTIQRSTSTFLDTQPNSSTKTKKELSNFMGSLLEVAKAETTKLGRYGGGQGSSGGKGGPGGHIVVAHISPHQSDSSETPPSYNQLTYNENLTRFFNSQPKTLSEREVQERYEERSSDMLEEGEGTTIGASNESSHHHHTTHHNKEKKKHGGCSGNKRRNGGGGGGEGGTGGRGGEDGAQSSAQGSRTSGEPGHASGSGEGNGNNSSTLQTGLSAGQINPGQEECMMSQDDGSGGSGSRLGSGSRDKKSGGGNASGCLDMFKPPALTQELLALHNRDMERRMLFKFKEDRRAGEIRFVKDSPKHRIIVPHTGDRGDGSGMVVGGNRAAAVAVANMKRMLSAAMGGPDSPLMLKGDGLHSAYGTGGAGVSGVNALPSGDGGQLKQNVEGRQAQRQQQRQHRRETAVMPDHHSHHHPQSVDTETGGDGGSHNPACMLRGSGAQHTWSAYGSGGGGGGVIAAAASHGAGPAVTMLKGVGNSTAGVAGSSGGSSTVKHGGHEGHFGYNQSNMMQRGTPPTLSGYSNLPGIPYGAYISGHRYGLGEAPYRGVQAGAAGVLASCPATKHPALLHSPNHQEGFYCVQPELPNCLAVNSCMLCHASSDKSSGRDQPPFNPEGGKKFVRPLSRTGSRATSVKGEPGSALESNASATASLNKERIVGSQVDQRGVNRTKFNVQGNESDPNGLSTSSSSLYSFLKTSEDYSGTNDSQNSSGEDANSLQKKEKRQQRAKPVLCDPFWLENVSMTRELVMTYQMEEPRDLEAILAADRERLRAMVQPPLVYTQLVELFNLFGGGERDTADCIELAKLDLEKDSASSSYEDSANSEDDDIEEEEVGQQRSTGQESESKLKAKMARRLGRLQRLNIFFEAEAPFPLPDTLRLGLSSSGRDIWRSTGGGGSGGGRSGPSGNSAVVRGSASCTGSSSSGGMMDLGQWAREEERGGAGGGGSSPGSSGSGKIRSSSRQLTTSNNSSGTDDSSAGGGGGKSVNTDVNHQQSSKDEQQSLGVGGGSSCTTSLCSTLQADNTGLSLTATEGKPPQATAAILLDSVAKEKEEDEQMNMSAAASEEPESGGSGGSGGDLNIVSACSSMNVTGEDEWGGREAAGSSETGPSGAEPDRSTTSDSDL